MSGLTKIYQQQKEGFLDNLQPDDFRNAASFNQIGDIIEQLNKALYQATIKKENSEDFIKKAATHLFREDSLAIAKLIDLSNIYLKMKLEQQN